MSLLAETSALLGDADSAAVLYRLLVPWAAFNVADVPEGMRGSVSRDLGLLASLLERFDDSERHFEDALAMNERMGLRPWLAHTQEDYGRMLIENGDEARGRSLVDRPLRRTVTSGWRPAGEGSGGDGGLDRGVPLPWPARGPRGRGGA